MSSVGSTGSTPFMPPPLTGFSSNSSTSSTGTNPLALSGLTSGIDTATIVNEMMSIERLPEQKLQLQLFQEQARTTALNDVKTQLALLQSDEQALQSPGLWAPSQTVSASDPTKISATLLGAAGPGGYQVNVTQLALSAQRTYNYTPPTADDTLTIGSASITIPSGSDINAAVSTINAAVNSPVFAAAVTDPSTGKQDLVLASRQTGAANGFTASDSQGSLSEITADAVAGQDAQFTLNGGAQKTSASNVVTNAIPGVQMTLSAITTVSGPVTVNVSSAAPNQSSIQSAIQTFVTQYNTTIDDLTSKLNEQPVPNPTTETDAAKGVLYGDMGLTELLSQLRNSLSGSYAPGNPSNLQYLSEVGLSTGAAVGSGGLNADSIEGKITLNASTFQMAMNNNPNAVQALFGGNAGGYGFTQAFDAILQPTTQPGGILDMRIADEAQTQSEINSQIANWNVRLAAEQTRLQKQFSNMETAMQQSQSQGNWLAGQISSLSGTPATSKPAGH